MLCSRETWRDTWWRDTCRVLRSKIVPKENSFDYFNIINTQKTYGGFLVPFSIIVKKIIPAQNWLFANTGLRKKKNWKMGSSLTPGFNLWHSSSPAVPSESSSPSYWLMTAFINSGDAWLLAIITIIICYLQQSSSSLLSEQSSSSSHLHMLMMHLWFLHWNCPSSHSASLPVFKNSRETALRALAHNQDRDHQTTTSRNTLPLIPHSEGIRVVCDYTRKSEKCNTMKENTYSIQNKRENASVLERRRRMLKTSQFSSFFKTTGLFHT